MLPVAVVAAMTNAATSAHQHGSNISHISNIGDFAAQIIVNSQSNAADMVFQVQ